MAPISITDAWLERVAADGHGKPAELPPGVAQVRYWDVALPGFGVVIGRRFATFVINARVRGRMRLAAIGRWGRVGAGADGSERWTVARARKRALALLGTMAGGEAPTTNRASSGFTLRTAFEAHVERLQRKGRSQATIETFRKSMAYLEAWLDRPIDDLDGEALGALYEDVKRRAAQRRHGTAKNERGAPLANRVITNVGTAWATLNRKLGGKLGNWNPAKSVERHALVPRRTRVLDLADWYARVQTMRSPIQRDGLVLALFTGLRHEDVRCIRLEHVDAEARTLLLPDPKGGEARAFTIPLSATCVEILERRARDNARELGREDASDKRADGGWLFPGLDRKGNVGPIGDLRQQTKTEAKRTDDKRGKTTTLARFPVESVHDLRRTYESVAHEAGISELDQHVLTNHSYASHNVNATYISQHLDHLAKCQATIEAALWRLIKPEPKPRAKLRSVA